MLDHRLRSPRPLGFEDWRARLDREHISPVITIAGSRGKTSVLRAVESILRAGGHRFASWTNHGVEIDGEKQRGELGPWSRALTSLTAGGLDVALQEVDWATVQALGTPTGAYPVLAVVNLCANNEACLVTPDTLLARKALDRIRASVAPTGRLILNADDYAVAAERGSESADRYFVGMSAEAPVLRRHLLEGGDACWLSGSSIVIQENDRTRPIVDTRWLRWTRGGRIPFAVQTALIATAVARASGIPEQVVSAGLVAHDARPESMPGSFNVFDVGSATVVVERPMPSWFLRASVRAASNLGAGRQIRLAGPMTSVATEDLPEIGRLLGRSGGVLIIHGEWTPDRLDLIRQGASGNEVPPIVVQAHDERSAILQGLDIIRPDDVMLVLAENPTAAIRLIMRRIRRNPTNSAREPRSAV
ncbi:MAG: hypothetical protein ACRDJC_18730 [Thermomicrobiales bacterium]